MNTQAQIKSEIDAICYGSAPNGDKLNTLLTDMNNATNIGALAVMALNLTQATTTAPTIAYKANSTGQTPTIARTSAGIYTLTFATAIGSSLLYNVGSYVDTGSTATYATIIKTSGTVITLNFTGATGTAKDALVIGLPIIIYIYA
jgi:hypothetical protein